MVSFYFPESGLCFNFLNKGDMVKKWCIIGFLQTVAVRTILCRK